MFSMLALALLMPAADTRCESLLAEHLRSDMKLSYEHFDQTEGRGFRALAASGCKAEAAALIEAYIKANGASERSLAWHVAQLRGESGQTEAALVAARSVLRADEAADAPFRWNSHVSAYIAFLERDRARFDQHVADLEAHAGTHAGNEMNAGFWRNLAPNFDAGYAQAVRLAYGQKTESRKPTQ